MTTRLSSCAWQGLARLVTTVVVCGVAALILPPSCEASAADPLESGLTATPDEAPARSDVMSGARVSDPDPNDTDDDDDDDDAAPDAPAATAVTAGVTIVWRESAVIREDHAARPLEPLDGHSLRGPPSLSPEDSSADFDDDDDDDASSDCSRGRTVTRQLQPLDHFVSHTEPARRHVHDGPQLRAP